MCYVLPDKREAVEAFLQQFSQSGQDAGPEEDLAAPDPGHDRRSELDALLQAGILTAEEYARAVGRLQAP